MSIGSHAGKYLLLCFVWMIGLPLGSSAQFLYWDYSNILDEERESGARPDMLLDSQGNLHIAYWHSSEDRAIYMVQQPGGTWLREYIQPATSNGYVTRMTLDANDIPHVVFMEDNNGKAEYRYAYRVGPSSWVVEDIPSDPTKGWGGYGPNAPLVASDRVQHSAHILIEDDGTPQIVFFDGWVTSSAFPFCTGSSNYEFELIQATKKAGLWVVRNFGEIDDINNSCGDPAVNTYPLPRGDRYGEFPQIIQKSDGTLETFCHSRYNNHVLRFRTTLNDTTWEKTPIDSLANRIDFASWSWSTIYFTFQGISAKVDRDDNVHLVYGSSFEYGDNFFGLEFTNVLGYTKAVGDDSLYHFTFGNVGSYTYRPYSDLALSGTDTICIVYSDLTTFELNSWLSVDGGLNWSPSKISDLLGAARSPVVCDGDSFYVAYYDTGSDALFMASQALSSGGGGTPAWTSRKLTQSANHGQSFDGLFQESNGDTVAHLAFNDDFNGNLFYAFGSQDNNWNYAIERIDSAAQNPRTVSVVASAGGTPVVAYAADSVGHAKLARRQGGNWIYEVVGDSANASYIDLVISPLDTLHYAYYDADRRCLRYQYRHLNDMSWIQDSIDCDTLPIGEHPSLALEGEIPHIAYYDGAGFQLKYARRDPSTRVWDIDTVITSVSSPVGKYNSLKLTSDGMPKIATLDEQNTHVLLAEMNPTGDWDVTKVDTSAVSNLGRPMDLVIDQFDNVWIAYNYNQNIDRVKLMHRDSQWREVSVSSVGQIANEFHFEIIGGDLFLAGKKNEPQNTGLAMLSSPRGLFVERAEAQRLKPALHLTNYPNPFSDATTFRIETERPETISLRIMDLNGRELYRVVDGNKLPAGATEFSFNGSAMSPGIYLAILENGSSRIIQKLIVGN